MGWAKLLRARPEVAGLADLAEENPLPCRRPLHYDPEVSLKTGAVAPSTMQKKLAAYERRNQPDLALQELGRIERTLFIYVIPMLESSDFWSALSSPSDAGRPASAGLGFAGMDAYARGLFEYLTFRSE